MELDNKKICDDYLSGKGIETIAKEYHVGKIKIRAILDENNIEIHGRGGQKIERKFVVSDYHIKKYLPREGYHYIAKAIDDSIVFDDYMNDGGHLTTYIKNYYGIDTPTLYDRRIYYQTTGNYWWEQWFNIILVKDKPVKKCPYCDWTTEDVDNNSGMFMTHLLKEHNISIDQYLIEYPEDKEYFSKQTNIIEKKKRLEKTENHVICPICGERLEKITYWHIKYKHNMEYDEFKIKYPSCKILSDNMLEQTITVQKLVNLTVSKKRFVSKYEMEIRKLLNDNNITYETNRQILIGKELDILVKDKKVAIEFNGIKWHTEWFGGKDRNYHLNKTLKCNEAGYGLIHIFEDEYVNHKTLVQNKILHILGCQTNAIKVGARKCIIREIKKHDAEVFLNQYHIQGFTSSTLYLGAFYNEKLVAVMTFKNGNIRNPYWELTRFASDYNYICQGVGGKLFKYFINTYNPSKVLSFADRRWTINLTNNLYIKLGFKLDRINPPDYKYYNENVDRYRRFHKMYFSKSKMHKKYGFPMTMTETEMVKELGYDRIWDCGLIKYVWTADWITKDE